MKKKREKKKREKEMEEREGILSGREESSYARTYVETRTIEMDTDLVHTVGVVRTLKTQHPSPKIKGQIL